MRSIFRGLIVALFTIVFSTAAMAGSMTSNKTIAQIAASNPNFSTLVTALKEAGLVNVLNGQGEFTVFAPTNAAFKKLPAGTLESLLKPENKAKLKQILLYHVVKGDYPAAKVASSSELKTVEGQDIKVTKEGNNVVLNGEAQVKKANITASNGVIHVINNVLLPPKKQS